MDVDQLVAAGLVTKSGDKVKMLTAMERRRERPLSPEEYEERVALGKHGLKRAKKDVRLLHPNDPMFRTAIDACHALALRYIEAGGGTGGTGSAKALALQQNWTRDSAVARLMEALVLAAPEAVRFDKGKNSAAIRFPEFRAWHSLLEALFGIVTPEWKEKMVPQGELFSGSAEENEEEMENDEKEFT